MLHGLIINVFDDFLALKNGFGTYILTLNNIGSYIKHHIASLLKNLQYEHLNCIRKILEWESMMRWGLLNLWNQILTILLSRNIGC